MLKLPLNQKYLAACYFFFGLSIFTSKSGLTLFGLILFVCSLFLLNFKELIKKEKLIFFLVGLYPLGALLNLFSLGAGESAKAFLSNFSWVLLTFPMLVILQRKDSAQKNLLKPLTMGALLGLLTASLYSLYIFGFEYGFDFSTPERVASFWDIGRWGTFTSAALIMLSGTILGHGFFKKSTLTQILILALTGLAALTLLLSKSRAPWVGGFLGLLTLVAFNKKARLYAILPGLIIAAALFFSPELQERIISITKVQTENGKLTSSDASNAGRLHMWKVAIDMYKENPVFGVGFHNSEAPLKDFLSRQGSEYQAQYVMTEFSFKDQHSSYLSSLVQNGVIFFAYFWGVLAFIFFKGLGEVLKSKNLVTTIALALFVRYLVEFLFYTSYESYEMTLLIPALTFIAFTDHDKFKIDNAL